jgi:hypothetical protein
MAGVYLCRTNDCAEKGKAQNTKRRIDLERKRVKGANAKIREGAWVTLLGN